ncbi:MAG TPA: hypothetical protein VFJ08_09035 [Salinisphaera sp.]|nr:hypothetical protein [Salinisphaera sp.]
MRSVRVALLLWALASAAPVAWAAGVQTLGQMARAEGWDPDAVSVPGYLNMEKHIPRDFPVPADAHDLTASNAVPFVGIKGVTAEEAEPFYHKMFARLGWSIHKEVKLPGYINFIACPETGWCVNLSAASPGGAVSPPGLNMQFFPRDAHL